MMRFYYPRVILCSFLFLLIGFTSNAQDVEPCATDQHHQELLNNDYSYQAQFEQMENELQKYIKRKTSGRQLRKIEGTVYQIPVVIHVIHTGGAVGSIYNPSNADINAMLGKINADFRATSTGNDAEIEFVLAQRSPACGATTGINRVDGSGLANYSANGVGTGGAADADVKALSIWSNTDYYNIWVVNKIDGNDGTSGSFTAGYAYFPGASANIDGTVILATQVNGSSTTMTHEIGHALNLRHTFHRAESNDDSQNSTDCPLNADCNVQGDLVCDTDPHAYMLGSCNTGNCGGVSQTTLDNYMSYCNGQNNFSPLQIVRMRTALETQRSGLISSLGGTPPSGSLPQVPSCTLSSTPTASNAFGVGRVRFGTIDVTSGSSATEGNYVDRTCGQGTTLTAGSSYTMDVKSFFTNSHRVRVYIDYNNNGDFTDTDEEVLVSNSGIDHTANVTIPSSGVVLNQSLRMRVVAAFIGDAAPTSCSVGRGQAEDFSIIVQSVALPSVNLSVSSNSTSEASPSAITVTATASSTVSGDQTVDLGVSGTGITAGDYNLSNATITILDGTTSGSVTFTVVDDALVEGTETARLAISNPSAGVTLGATTTQDITITDNDVATPTITLGAITPTTYCAGANISLPFTTTGTFNGGNTFTAQLSDASGNFGSPTATQAGISPISITVPANASTAATYKIRVIASDPSTTSNESGAITINALPADRTIVANPASITSGNTTNIEVPNTENGVSYQLQDVSNSNANVGSPVVGNGGTMQLPTQALTANNDFRVVATRNGCSSILNTVTVTVIPACSITSITADSQTACVPATNTYTQDITVNYSNPPASGDLVVNGQNFGITASPQTVTLTGLTSNGVPVDVTASFSADPACSFTQTNAYVAPATCTPPTGNVSNTDQTKFYSTIQEAVDDANPSEEVLITVDGTYSENVTIDKNITLTSNATNYQDVTIDQILVNDGVTLTIDGNMSVLELVHLQGATSQVIVNGGASFALRSTASGTAMVINDGANTISGDVIMERYVPDPTTIPDFTGTYSGRGYHMFSSPFSDATVSQFGDNMNLVVTPSYNASDEPAYTVPFPSFYRFDERRTDDASTSGYYSAFTMGYEVPLLTDNLEIGRGYEANLNTGALVDLSGELNNGDIVLSIANSSIFNTATGFNLVGNPYPSPINWTDVYNLSTDISPVISIDIKTGRYAANFATYNALTTMSINGGTSEIASMQGFFIRATGAGAELVMNNSVRPDSYQNTRFFKPSTTNIAIEGVIKLGIFSEGNVDETAIGFIDGATSGFDDLYDAEKMHKINGYVSTLYSYNKDVNSEDNEYYAINVLPKFDENMVLPLAMNIVKSGKHKITVRDIKHFHSLSNIYLYDSLTETLHDLKVESEYEFVAEAAREVKRFVLLFKPPVNGAFSQFDQMVVYPNPSTGKFSYSLKSTSEGRMLIRLYDATGKLIIEREQQKEGAFLEGTLDLSSKSVGLYLLQVSDGTRTTNARLVKE